MADQAQHWSDLSIDLLSEILRFLTLVDYIHFGAVCKSWRSAVNQKRYLPAPQIPWLLLPNGQFFSIPDKRVYKLDVPQEIFQRRLCKGSSNGWLITVDEEVFCGASREMQLFNPLTRAQIQLPQVGSSTFQGSDGQLIKVYYNPRYAILVPCGPNFSTLSDGYTVVMCGHNDRLAFVRAGDERWTLLDEPFTGFGDVVHHEGLFYALDYEGSIVAFDLTGATPEVKGISSVPMTCLDSNIHLVQAPGVLLQVQVSDSALYDSSVSRSDFEVFQLDPNGWKWVPVKVLDGLSIFLGFGVSLALSTWEFPELRGNCIYFINSSEKVDHYADVYRSLINDVKFNTDVYRHLSMFNLNDGHMELYYSYITRLKCAAPFWFTPTLW